MPDDNNNRRWEKTLSITKRGYGFGKKGFDKAWNAVDKLGTPVNKLSNRIGCEAFWPMTLDKESDKAARILRSFCKDGFYESLQEHRGSHHHHENSGPRGRQRVLKKVPARVIQNAKGLCIFTTMRSGFWVSGSGGSGVLIGRIPETGEWSPPSGIMLHTAGIGFLAGIDIYDCIVVINTYEALKAFKTFRCTVGGEISAAAGPVGIGGVLDSEVHKRQHPIWTYMKSKGLYAGAQIDGTVIIERTDENERFYGGRYNVNEILGGEIRHPPVEINGLLETVKAAQGDHDNFSAVPLGDAPSDMQPLPPTGSMSSPTDNFGIPAAGDPDPYGVKALEAEGLYIREAGTQERPSRDTFEFRPAITSPILSRGSWGRRTSTASHASRKSTSTDRGVQTDTMIPTSTSAAPPSISSPGSPLELNAHDYSESSNNHHNGGANHRASPLSFQTTPLSSPLAQNMQMDMDDDDDRSIDEDEIDDVEVHDASTVARQHNTTATRNHHMDRALVESSQQSSSSSTGQSPTNNFTRAKLVTIPKRPLATPPSSNNINNNRPVPPPPPTLHHRPVPPPPLPARNPHRPTGSPLQNSPVHLPQQHKDHLLEDHIPALSTTAEVQQQQQHNNGEEMQNGNDDDDEHITAASNDSSRKLPDADASPYMAEVQQPQTVELGHSNHHHNDDEADNKEEEDGVEDIQQTLPDGGSAAAAAATAAAALVGQRSPTSSYNTSDAEPEEEEQEGNMHVPADSSVTSTQDVGEEAGKEDNSTASSDDNSKSLRQLSASAGGNETEDAASSDNLKPLQQLSASAGDGGTVKESAATEDSAEDEKKNGPAIDDDYETSATGVGAPDNVADSSSSMEKPVKASVSSEESIHLPGAFD